jgi:hypothetical protein
MLKSGDCVGQARCCEVHLLVLQTMAEQFQLGKWKTALFGIHVMHLITQSVQVLPCSNSAMEGNNGTNRMLYHDIAAQTITEPPPCFTVETRYSGLYASLGVLQTQNFPDVDNSVKDDSSDHIMCAFPFV